MIEDDIAAVLDGEGVVSAPFLTISVRPDANVPDDDVMRALDHQRGEAIGSSRMGQQYAAAGRGLPGDRQIGIVDDRRLTREADDAAHGRSEEHTSELQSLMRISYAVFCLKKKK